MTLDSSALIAIPGLGWLARPLWQTFKNNA